MPANEYAFRTEWVVDGTSEEVYRIIEDTPAFARWWPSVWLKVETLDKGDEHGLGSSYRYTTKGWLPYLLHWTSRTIEKKFPTRIALEASGDFVGSGVWTFTPDGSRVVMVYDWRLTADKPLLKYLSFLLKPVFSFNHRWAMDRGLESLKLELARRRATDDEARARIPSPPAARFWFGMPRELDGANKRPVV